MFSLDVFSGFVRLLLWLTHPSSRFRLIQLNNFSSTMAIISGLSAAATLRLKFTREGLKRSARRRLEELEEQMSAEISYSNYRNILSQVSPRVCRPGGLCVSPRSHRCVIYAAI